MLVAWTDHAKQRAVERFGVEWLDMPHINAKPLQAAAAGGIRKLCIRAGKAKYALRLDGSKWVILSVMRWDLERQGRHPDGRKSKAKNRDSLQLATENG